MDPDAMARLRVTAVELDPRAVQIMRWRGLEDVRCLDLFQLRDGCFDTLLMLGQRIGIVENLEGRDRFLAQAYRLVRADGQLLLNSLHPRRTEDPVHLNYHEEETGDYLARLTLDETRDLKEMCRAQNGSAPGHHRGPDRPRL